jgi:Flp pilus assembly protein TadD
LTSERLALLSEPEQRAVESGLLQANAADRPEAPFELGAFYNAVGRYADAARSYEAAALNADDDRGKLHGLLLGGSALMRAGETAKAEALVRQAITVTPRDPRPYRQLISQVYAVKEDIEGAREIVKEGVRNGVPPVPLLLALADTAQKLGNREIAKAALIEALPKQGGSFEVLAALGRVYLQEKNFDRAALTLRKAARLNPDDVSVVSALAAAEEGRYRFAAAQDAYTRALSLDATNTGLRGRYEALLRKMSENQ